MSTSFYLSNFKGFKEVNPVELKPFTVICGTNNSGKSSLIQSLLLMKQSNIENIKAPLSVYIQEPLVFNGLYAHLGNYQDVVHNHSNETEVKFSWKVRNENYKNINSEIVIGFKNKNVDLLESKEKLFVNNFLFYDFNLNFSLEITRTKGENYRLTLNNIRLEDFLMKWIFSNLRYYQYTTYTTRVAELVKKFNETKYFAEKVIEKIYFDEVQVKLEGIFPSHLLIKNFAKQSLRELKEILSSMIGVRRVPKYLLQFIEMTISDLDSYIKKTSLKRNESRITTTDPSHDGSIFPVTKNEYPYFSKNKEFFLLEPYAEPYAAYRITVVFLRKFWSGFRYIGPIREAPKRFYLFDDLRRIDIGVNGEYTPLVLAVEQDIIIPKYYRCIYQGKQIIDYELREKDKLLESVNWWLSECMKLPQIDSVAGFRGVINQVKLNSSGVPVDLPDVGFGVSQVLPILVECLRTAEGETIILEQPEIHLHPSLQSKLADFFLCMAKSGKNLVIETHSEHLINRVCLRIAQETSNEIRCLINILFVSFDEQDKTSVSKPIKINEYGEIENWPVGFFDENDSREILAATLKKRMSTTNG